MGPLVEEPTNLDDNGDFELQSQSRTARAVEEEEEEEEDPPPFLLPRGGGGARAELTTTRSTWRPTVGKKIAWSLCLLPKPHG